MAVAKSRVAVIAVLLVTVCGGPWGCAVKGHLSPSALSDEVRAQLNTVGVSTAPLPPEAGLDAPRSGKAWGALKGAGSGLAVGAVPGLAIASGVSGCRGGGPAALACGTILVAGLGVAAAGGTVGALVGSVYGAVTAESASKVRAAQIELENALRDVDVQATLRDHVLQTSRERSSVRLVALEEGVDTVLEVRVAAVRFVGQGGINPPLSVIMTAPVRLLRAADGAELYAATFEYRSPGAYKISDWASRIAWRFARPSPRVREAWPGRSCSSFSGNNRIASAPPPPRAPTRPPRAPTRSSRRRSFRSALTWMRSRTRLASSPTSGREQR